MKHVRVLRWALFFLIAAPGLGQAQPIQVQPSLRSLSTTARPADTPYWRVDDFGFTSIVVHEQHGEWRYPNYENVNAAGYFRPDPHNVGVGDFNGDGHQDMVVTWVALPHVIARTGDLPVSVYLNDGAGHLVHRPDIWAGPAPRRKHIMYRTRVADFNGDGRSDFVVAPQGLIERTGPGQFQNTYEPVLLVLSRPDGKLEDASARIQGQENGGIVPGILFSHDMSAGDLDGDGDADFVTAKHVFLNDGTGRFSASSTALPPETRPGDTYVMSTAIGELNGDGVGDLVVSVSQDGGPKPLAYVLLSRGRSVTDRQIVALPDVVFGPNNARANDVLVGDVTGDGRNDIVFGLTRVQPYYQGRAVRIFVNQGNGAFVDETDARLSDPRKEYSTNGSVGLGEGTLHLVDVNRDGHRDIVDATGAEDGFGTKESSQPGLHVFLNRGNGTFATVPRSAFPWVQRWQMSGFEGYRPYAEGPLELSYPIDLDGRGGIEFVSFVRTPLSGWPQAEPSELSLYVLRGTDQRYQPVTTGVEDDARAELALEAPTPNPFRHTTALSFSLPQAGWVRLSVHDLMGREVAVLADEVRTAGLHRLAFDGSALPSGLYFYRLTSTDGTRTGAMTKAE